MGSNKWNKKKAGEFLSPTLSRGFILKKYILKMAGDIKGKSLVEFGSGNGFWLKHFTQAGAKCTGVDHSEEQIKLAKKEFGDSVILLKQDVVKFNTRKKFDIVYIDHVLSETASKQMVSKILRSARLALKKSGFLILNEMHPSVAYFPFKNTRTENDSYFKSGSKIHFRVKKVDGKYIDITDYHWTIGDFTNLLKESGFLIEEITEPQAPKSVSGEYLKLRQILFNFCSC